MNCRVGRGAAPARSDSVKLSIVLLFASGLPIIRALRAFDRDEVHLELITGVSASLACLSIDRLRRAALFARRSAALTALLGFAWMMNASIFRIFQSVSAFVPEFTSTPNGHVRSQIAHFQNSDRRSDIGIGVAHDNFPADRPIVCLSGASNLTLLR